MLYIKIKKLSNSLDKTQWKGINDFRIFITYGNQNRNTTVLWNDNNPVWNETFLFDLDKKVSKIIIKLADEDIYGKTKILKETTINAHNDKIKKFTDDIIDYEMGNIHFKKNIEIKKLKHTLENTQIKLDNINLILND